MGAERNGKSKAGRFSLHQLLQECNFNSIVKDTTSQTHVYFQICNIVK